MQRKLCRRRPLPAERAALVLLGFLAASRAAPAFLPAGARSSAHSAAPAAGAYGVLSAPLGALAVTEGYEDYNMAMASSTPPAAVDAAAKSGGSDSGGPIIFVAVLFLAIVTIPALIGIFGKKEPPTGPGN
mmetsp:Transcript_134848/g.418972  ORF Transcript_134848/g.418972 Transcript_134848/m.418972 type:complete len:131 (+) Transcript_134848:65-457(+)